MEILPMRQWHTWFRNVSAGVFGGRLRHNTASGEEELCLVRLVVSCLEEASRIFQGDSDTKAKEYSLVAKKKRNIRKVLREDDMDPLTHIQSGQPLEKFFADGANAVGSFIMRSLGHLTTTPVYNFLRLTTLHFAMQERSVEDPLAC